MDKVLYYAHGWKPFCVYVLSNADSNTAALYKIHWRFRA